MTTIAYKNGVFAYDSRSTCESVITNNNTDKRRIVNGVVFILCCAVADYPYIIDAYFGCTVKKNFDCAGFAIDIGRLYEIGINNNDGFWKMGFPARNCRALGSGYKFALTAMDLGCDAVKAVKMAAKRDTGTGGRVRVYQVKK